jgi:hypothetical protein
VNRCSLAAAEQFVCALISTPSDPSASS